MENTRKMLLELVRERIADTSPQASNYLYALRALELLTDRVVGQFCVLSNHVREEAFDEALSILRGDK